MKSIPLVYTMLPFFKPYTVRKVKHMKERRHFLFSYTHSVKKNSYLYVEMNLAAEKSLAGSPNPWQATQGGLGYVLLTLQIFEGSQKVPQIRDASFPVGVL